MVRIFGVLIQHEHAAVSHFPWMFRNLPEPGHGGPGGRDPRRRGAARAGALGPRLVCPRGLFAVRANPRGSSQNLSQRLAFPSVSQDMSVNDVIREV